MFSATCDWFCTDGSHIMKLVADLTRDIKCEVLKRSFDFVLDLSLGWSVGVIADEVLQVRINALQFIYPLQPNGKQVYF